MKFKENDKVVIKDVPRHLYYGALLAEGRILYVCKVPDTHRVSSDRAGNINAVYLKRSISKKSWDY